MKDSFKKIGHEFKKLGQEIGHTGEEVAHEAKKAGQTVAKEAGQDVGHGLASALREFSAGIKKAWQKLWD